MPGLATKIDHIVVLMLENRSFDCLLGKLYPKSAEFNGLAGDEANPYVKSNGQIEQVPVWSDPTLEPGMMTIPDPDPGELFSQDMNIQLFGRNGTPSLAAPPMIGFVDNYMQQPPADSPYDYRAPMHYFTPEQVPVISLLAKSFAVCDQWHASAPCQTWPNRFFAHTGTAGGYVNNSPAHFPYLMPSIFHRLHCVGRSSRVYFHDVPQSITLADQWLTAAERFRPFDEFLDDARTGALPDYAFIEPRYFTDNVLNLMPNDQHPPHDVVYGEQLIANVYNAIRSSPAWKKLLFVITYDEHGGCFDHSPPPLATPPDNSTDESGFRFDRYGVRVPAVIISPYINQNTILRSSHDGLSHNGPTRPFDHTSIIRTVRDRFDSAGSSLTARDALAPSLDLALNLDEPTNNGPDQVEPLPYTPTASDIQKAKSGALNANQRSLCGLTAHLPQAGADILQHIDSLRAKTSQISVPELNSVADAANVIRDNLKSFLDYL